MFFHGSMSYCPDTDFKAQMEKDHTSCQLKNDQPTAIRKLTTLKGCEKGLPVTGKMLSIGWGERTFPGTFALA